MNTKLQLNIGTRLASFALLIASFAMVFAACDSGGGNIDTTVASDSLQISDISPDVGTDFQTVDTSITFTFTRPVAENEYTRTDAEPTSGNRHLIDAVQLGAQAKDLSPNNSIPVSLEFNDDRNQLTVAPEDSLRDGFVYTLVMGDSANGTGFYDPRFKAEDGSKFVENPNLPNNLMYNFSVGVDTSRPSVPSVAFDTEDGDVNDDGTLEAGAFNYTHATVSVPLRISEVGDNVKGYEVYYRSQNEVGRTGNGDQFRKADLMEGTGEDSDVSPEAVASDFEEYKGIIPAYQAESGNFGDGTLPFNTTLYNGPFIGNNGAYGPIEVKVRAVSINNVRSDFTDVFTVPDNDSLDLNTGFRDTWYVDADDDDDQELRVEFNEPVSRSSIDTDSPGNQFTLDNGGTDNVQLDSVSQINNTTTQAVVIIELTGDPTSSPIDDELTVDADGVTDLAGNPVTVEGNDNTDSDLTQ